MLAEVILSLQKPVAHNAKLWTGHKFETGSIILGYLYSRYVGQKRKVKKTFWLVRCACGNENIRDCGAIRTGEAKLCTECKCKQKRIIELGYEFGKGCKIVKELTPKINCKGAKVRIFQARCHCGKVWKITSGNVCNISECRACAAKTMGKKRIGENHHNWNPNLTDEERFLMKENRKRDPDYAEFREAVYKRDNYKCVISGKSGNLNCHHLDGWHWARDKRYNVDNAVSLDADLHVQFHSLYGNRNNTKQQFEEFKSNINLEI